MKIIISPAKKMEAAEGWEEGLKMPVFLEEAKQLLKLLQALEFGQLKQLFKANDDITRLNLERFSSMDLEKGLSPAALTYIGIQYQHMAPKVFTESQWKYACKNLRILSGFYGILRPDDGIVPYRLEMQAKLSGPDFKDLYEFWGDKLYRELTKDGEEIILNLASKEYSKAAEPFIKQPVSLKTCVFGTLAEGKIKVKATEAKMARGEMVRFLAEKNAVSIEEVKEFCEGGFSFDESRSDDNTLVFLKGGK